MTVSLEVPNLHLYVEQQTKLSDGEVGRGRSPLRRIAAPAIPVRVQESNRKTGASQWGSASSWDVVIENIQAVLLRIGANGLEGAMVGGSYGDTISPLVDPADSNTLSSLPLMQAVSSLWLTQPKTLLVFEDQASVSRFVMLAGRIRPKGFALGQDPITKATHQIQLCASLPASSRVVRLVEACEQTFWRPSEVAHGDFGGWSKTLSTRTGYEAMRDVLIRVLTGTASDSQARFLNAVVKAEEAMLGATTGFRDPHTAINGYHAASQINEAWDAYVQSDAAHLPESAAAGQAPMMVPLRVKDGLVMARVSTPCRLKVRSKVRLYATDGTTIGDTRLMGLTFSDEYGMIGLFGNTYSSKRDGARPSVAKGYRWLQEQISLRSGAMAYMVAEPHLGSGMQAMLTKWSKGTPSGDPIYGNRDVPLDISLSGAGS